MRLPLLPMPKKSSLGTLESHGVGYVLRDQDHSLPFQVPCRLQFVP